MFHIKNRVFTPLVLTQTRVLITYSTLCHNPLLHPLQYYNLYFNIQATITIALFFWSNSVFFSLSMLICSLNYDFKINTFYYFIRGYFRPVLILALLHFQTVSSRLDNLPKCNCVKKRYYLQE